MTDKTITLPNAAMVYIVPVVTDLFQQESLCPLSRVEVAQHLVNIATCELLESVDTRVGKLEMLLRQSMQLYYQDDFLEKMVLEYTLKGYFELSSIKQHFKRNATTVHPGYPRLSVINVLDKDIVMAPKAFNMEILL